MIIYNYLWLSLTTCDFVWLCMTIYFYVWLCLPLFTFVFLCWNDASMHKGNFKILSLCKKDKITKIGFMIKKKCILRMLSERIIVLLDMRKLGNEEASGLVRIVMVRKPCLSSQFNCIFLKFFKYVILHQTERKQKWF